MKIMRVTTIVLAVYVLLGLCFGAGIGYFQPRSDETLVLRTLDASGVSHETVLRARNDNGQLWLVSGQWFRGWYNRAILNPDVEIIQGDTITAYRAVSVDSPEALDMIMRKEKAAGTARFWFGRAMVLFAPFRLIRLDPPVSTPSE